eukprot:13611703-Alexandrium_andersonii.AAC.1
MHCSEPCARVLLDSRRACLHQCVQSASASQRRKRLAIAATVVAVFSAATASAGSRTLMAMAHLIAAMVGVA